MKSVDDKTCVMTFYNQLGLLLTEYWQRCNDTGIGIGDTGTSSPILISAWYHRYEGHRVLICTCHIILTLLMPVYSLAAWAIKALNWIHRCAMVTICCQVCTIFLISDSMSRGQVFLGRPLVLFLYIDPMSRASFCFYFYWQLICLRPPSVVAEFVWPFHICDSPEAYLLTKVSILSTVCLVVILQVSEL